jgi:hypothetical protein
VNAASFIGFETPLLGLQATRLVAHGGGRREGSMGDAVDGSNLGRVLLRLKVHVETA